MTLFVNDRPLLEAYRRGESQALGAVYDFAIDSVLSLLRHGFSFQSQGRALRFRGVFDPCSQEVFCQDIFLRLFEERTRLSYDGLRPFMPFLMQVAKNLIIDRLRSQQRDLERLVVPLEAGEHSGGGKEIAETVYHSEPTAEDQLDAARAQRQITEFLQHCDPTARRLLALRFAQEESLASTARRLGLTRMRARWLEKKVLGQLRRFLQTQNEAKTQTVSPSQVLP